MEYYTEEVRQIKEALENSWSRISSSGSDDWDKDNPAYAQCAVTALVVQDYLGGRIEWREILVEDNSGYEDYFENGDRISHYINRVDGHNMDFTRKQFPEDHAVLFIPEKYHDKMEGFDNVRDYILSSEDTCSRYGYLKESVESYLEKDRVLELT